MTNSAVTVICVAPSAGASATHAFCIHNFLGAVRVQTMGAQKN
jgi:hypothetical protein